MKQSEEVNYRTEIAQLKATLHNLRFALPLKKAAEEFIKEVKDRYPKGGPKTLEHHVSQLKEALDDKRRYQAVDDGNLD